LHFIVGEHQVRPYIDGIAAIDAVSLESSTSIDACEHIDIDGIVAIGDISMVSNDLLPEMH